LRTWCSWCDSHSWVVLLSSWRWVLPFCSLYFNLFFLGVLVSSWLAGFNHHLVSYSAFVPRDYF
jgi:hypothetical protein